MPEDNSASHPYDLILIGSGMGALTVASLMARLRGKRVLILEQHFRAGGYTHAFQRGRFSWDVGVHYIGEMGEGSRVGQLFRLITGGKVVWNRMPDPYDVFEYPDLTFGACSGKDRLIDDLASVFPSEREAIEAYVRDVSHAATAFGMNIMRRNSSAVARGVGAFGKAFLSSRWDLTTKAYLDEHFSDPKLKAILASQWGDYGLPPSQSPFMLHSLIVHHYLNGAWYPVGGAGTFARGVQDVVEASGGRILLSREVTEVLIENGRAIGVRVRNGRGETEEYRAPVVVSNAGAALTYSKLLPANEPIAFRDSLARFVERHPPTSHLSLYVGFSRDPRELGFRGENHWLFKRCDHDANYARLGQWIEICEPEEVYLSFPSLKDPEAKAHTAELVTFTNYESFSKWKHQPWRRRDAQYQALKERITEGMLDFVERHHPGFRDLVEFRELSTPLTNEFMTGHYKGAIYGLPSVPERFRKENLSWTDPKTPVEGLYLTGADVSSLGIVGAMMGGLTTLGYLPDGISMPRAFSAAAKA